MDCFYAHKNTSLWLAAGDIILRLKGKWKYYSLKIREPDGLMTARRKSRGCTNVGLVLTRNCLSQPVRNVLSHFPRNIEPRRMIVWTAEMWVFKY